MASPKKKTVKKKTAQSKSTGRKTAGAVKSTRTEKAAAAKSPARAKPGKASSTKTSTTTTKAAAARKMNSTVKTASSKKTKTTAAKTTVAKTKATKSAAKGSPTKQKTAPSSARAAKPAVTGILIVGGIEPYKEKPGEQYMSDGQIEHYRKILQTWRKELMEEVDRTVHNMQKEAANFPDPNDRATQESEFTMELRARDRERKLIKKIDESLASLESGDYGYCESCGVEIGIRRLEARPTATLCIDCKTLDEIRERRVGE